MVITMDIKNVNQRGGRFYFRMRVPQDCIEKIGKKEITQSLKTDDPLRADKAAQKLTKIWTDRFAEARSSSATPPVRAPLSTKTTTIDMFRQKILDQMEVNLPVILEEEDEKELKQRLNYYRGAMKIMHRGSPCPTQFDFPEIGACWRSKATGSPGSDRRRRKVIYEALKQMCEMIEQELTLGITLEPKESKVVSRPVLIPEPETPSSASAEETDIKEVANLMLESKVRDAKTKMTVKADVGVLQEWTGKSNLRSFTKRDLVDFVTNCLPYIPANRSQKKALKNKPIRDCIAMFRENPNAYKPISYITCRNRLINISMVFNYAKDCLGIIHLNPAKGVEPPKIRVVEKRPRGFTSNELAAMWGVLPAIRQEEENPSRYWAPILSLYHGFRLNEICALFVRDVYEDPAGIPIIDVNDNHATKSVKNKSSARMVPVHPFVWDQLGFRDFVEEQKKRRADETLFTDVVWNDKKGYRDRTSKWFSRWKREWLPGEARYKHFHDLRHTFIQTAQNVAKMPDRHAQEITGHSVAGVSDVHLAYSGRLKPADLLPELEKVRYGWEEG